MIEGHKEKVQQLFTEIEQEVQGLLERQDSIDNDLAIKQHITQRLQNHAKQYGLEMFGLKDVQGQFEDYYPINHQTQANLDLLFAIEAGLNPRKIDVEKASKVVSGGLALISFIRNTRLPKHHRKRLNIISRTISAVTLYGTVNKFSKHYIFPTVNHFLYQFDVGNYLNDVQESFTKYLVKSEQIQATSNQKLVNSSTQAPNN